MNKIKIINKLSKEFQKYDLFKIKSGASKKNFYKIKNNNKSFILIDFNLDQEEYKNHIKTYNILKNIDISIPKIIESYDTNLMIITEDFGNLRYDKIILEYNLKDLLKYAVDTLIQIKNSIYFDNKLHLNKYNSYEYKADNDKKQRSYLYYPCI